MGERSGEEGGQEWDSAPGSVANSKAKYLEVSEK